MLFVRRDLLASSVVSTGSAAMATSSDTNRNVSKYKVNRVAAAAAASAASNKDKSSGLNVSTGTTSSSTPSAGCVIGRVECKAPQRAVAERCVERLITGGAIPSTVLADMFSSSGVPSEARQIVDKVIAEIVVATPAPAVSGQHEGTTEGRKVNQLFAKYFEA